MDAYHNGNHVSTEPIGLSNIIGPALHFLTWKSVDADDVKNLINNISK